MFITIFTIIMLIIMSVALLLSIGTYIYDIKRGHSNQQIVDFVKQQLLTPRQVEIPIAKFTKLKPDAIIPTKREEDGCYDLYACIDEDIIIPAHTTKLIPTGINSAFESNYRVSVRERGSNIKWGGIIMAGQIDSGFRGEWFVAIYNSNDIPVVLTQNTIDIKKKENEILVPVTKAIAQFAFEIVPTMNIREVTLEEIQAVSSERGNGSLGSSGK